MLDVVLFMLGWFVFACILGITMATILERLGRPSRPEGVFCSECGNEIVDYGMIREDKVYCENCSPSPRMLYPPKDTWEDL